MTITVTEVIQPALDAYAAALDEHGHQSYSAGAVCICGWEPRATMQDKSKRRAVGLHASAAQKRASKAYDKEAARLMAEAYKPGGVWAR